MSAAIASGGVRSRAITATPRSSAGCGAGELGERLEALGAGVVVRPDRVVAELGAARRQRPGDLGVEPGRDSEAAAAHGRPSPAAPRTRCAGSGGTCRPASRGAAYSRPRPAGRRWGRAWSGCRRRRRSSSPRTRSARRTIFCERPARGGSTTTTSGLPACSISGRTPVRALPAMKWAFSIPLRSALRSASAIASGTISSPQTSPASLGHRQPDRADPAVEVEDALAAAQAGELGGDRVEALGHLGVGLEEGAVGHLQLAARRAPRAGAPRRARRSGRRCRRSRPRSPCAGRPGACGKRAGEVTRRVWIWPVRRPSRTTRLRRTPSSVRAGRRRGSTPAGPSRGPRCGPRCRARRRAGSRRRRRSGPSGRGRGSRGSARPRARRRSTRACCGSATARSAGTICSSSKPSRSPIRRSASSTCSLLWVSWRS